LRSLVADEEGEAESGDTGDSGESGESGASSESTTTVEYESRGGVLLFRDGDSIEVIDDHVTSDYGVIRCIYIDDYIYAIDELDTIVSFEYAGGTAAED